MQYKIILTCLSLIASIQLGWAQQNMFSLQYSVGFPTSELNDYIGETSFRGLALDYTYLTSTNLSFGISGGVNTFYERKGYDTYNEGTASLTGTQYRYTNSFPIMASVGYFLNPAQTLTPYASLGIGTIYTLRDTRIGSYSTETDTWHFSLRPEIGIIYRLSSKLGFKLAGKYYQTFEADELPAQSYATLDMGIVLYPAPR
ncbi:outer membrane beta-barrel protein [Catalinimonas sp. 4WD22]|uniref:outer membrane beta-barrel protein n=1 Tax=Catalinimonas locisalis TaxID=3133978 RepID=UPI003101A747